AYFEPINWHRTALHELGHASGHTSRLNRDLSGSFGSKKYAFERCPRLLRFARWRHPPSPGTKCPPLVWRR
ncbi:MAG: zincin-like metallopeptidase domain-containing protein, partial [Methylocella sp.]